MATYLVAKIIFFTLRLRDQFGAVTRGVFETHPGCVSITRGPPPAEGQIKWGWGGWGGDGGWGGGRGAQGLKASRP